MHLIPHNGQAFSPDGKVGAMTSEDVMAHNEAQNAAELVHWAAKPEYFAAYVVENDKVQTWLGADIGRVISRSTFRNNLTGQPVEAIQVRGNNGAVYYGRYSSNWAQLVRLRRCKV